MTITVYNAPKSHWYSSMVGAQFEVVEYNESYEAYLVKDKDGNDRYVYRRDCEPRDLKSELTLVEQALLNLSDGKRINKVRFEFENGKAVTLTRNTMPHFVHEFEQMLKELKRKV